MTDWNDSKFDDNFWDDDGADGVGHDNDNDGGDTPRADNYTTENASATGEGSGGEEVVGTLSDGGESSVGKKSSNKDVTTTTADTGGATTSTTAAAARAGTATATSSSFHCPNCNSPNIESLGPSGSSVCTDCGIIVEENTIVSSVEFVEGAGGSSSMVGQFVGANSTRGFGTGGRRGGQYGFSRQSRENTVSLIIHMNVMCG